MIYYRNRYYNPAIGRFISEDPLKFFAGINFYSYTLNDPVNFTDPLGMDTYYGGVTGSGFASVGMSANLLIAFNLGFTQGENFDLGLVAGLGVGIGVDMGYGYCVGKSKGSLLNMQDLEGDKSINYSGAFDPVGLSVSKDTHSGEVTDFAIQFGGADLFPVSGSASVGPTVVMSANDFLRKTFGPMIDFIRDMPQRIQGQACPCKKR